MKNRRFLLVVVMLVLAFPLFGQYTARTLANTTWSYSYSYRSMAGFLINRNYAYYFGNGNYRFVSNDSNIDGETGTFSISNDTITFKPSGKTYTYTGIFIGNSLTVNIIGRNSLDQVLGLEEKLYKYELTLTRIQ